MHLFESLFIVMREQSRPGFMGYRLANGVAFADNLNRHEL